MDVKEFIGKYNFAKFDSFRNGVFYYEIGHPVSMMKYQFQIPIEDISGATLNCYEKSVSMMRWIRKSMEDKTFIKL